MNCGKKEAGSPEALTFYKTYKESVNFFFFPFLITAAFSHLTGHMYLFRKNFVCLCCDSDYNAK
jgi:hypothetical protein